MKSRSPNLQGKRLLEWAQVKRTYSYGTNTASRIFLSRDRISTYSTTHDRAYDDVTCTSSESTRPSGEAVRERAVVALPGGSTSQWTQTDKPHYGSKNTILIRPNMGGAAAGIPAGSEQTNTARVQRVHLTHRTLFRSSEVVRVHRREGSDVDDVGGSTAHRNPYESKTPKRQTPRGEEYQTRKPAFEMENRR